MVEFNYDVLSITSMAYMAILGVFGVSLNAFAIRKALIVSCHLWKIVLIYQFDINSPEVVQLLCYLKRI